MELNKPNTCKKKGGEKGGGERGGGKTCEPLKGQKKERT